MARGEAVTDRDAGKFEGRSTGLGDAQFDRLDQRVEVNVAGHEFIKGIDHGHQRLLQVLRVPAHGVKKGTMGGPVKPPGHDGVVERFFRFFFPSQVCLLYTIIA